MKYTKNIENKFMSKEITCSSSLLKDAYHCSCVASCNKKV